MPRRRQQMGMGVVRKKRLYLILTLCSENRARAVQQSPPRLQQWPQGLEQSGLDRDKLGNIGLPAQPAHIGVTPHNA